MTSTDTNELIAHYRLLRQLTNEAIAVTKLRDYHSRLATTTTGSTRDEHMHLAQQADQELYDIRTELASKCRSSQ